MDNREKEKEMVIHIHFDWKAYKFVVDTLVKMQRNGK